MLNIKKALKLRKPKDLLWAVQEAEASNCSLEVIDKLNALYYEALEKETMRKLRKSRSKSGQ